jgi:hypothetical protein
MRSMTKSIRDTVNFYLQKFFNYFTKDSETDPVKRRKKYKKGRSKTIKQTLENLDQNFKELSRATSKHSWDNTVNVKGLKKLGVFVPPVGLGMSDVLKSKVRVPEKFPGIMFVATNNFFPDYSDLTVPNFFYAFKYKKVPHYVEPTKDVVYKIGISIPCAKNTTIKSKNVWMFYFIAVSNEGEVRTLRWVNEQKVEIPAIKGRPSERVTWYARKSWAHPNLFPPDERIDKYTELLHSGIFCACFNFWTQRDQMWTVQTKKNDLRMTFCVDTKDTKHYFRDREYVTTLNGHRKKIIHFVETHTRVTPAGKSIVREHIRGERKFQWNSYQCNVKAPKFNNTTSMVDFHVAVDEDDGAPLEVGTMDAVGLANELTPLFDSEQDNVYSSRDKG